MAVLGSAAGSFAARGGRGGRLGRGGSVVDDALARVERLRAGGARGEEQRGDGGVEGTRHVASLSRLGRAFSARRGTFAASPFTLETPPTTLPATGRPHR